MARSKRFNHISFCTGADLGFSRGGGRGGGGGGVVKQVKKAVFGHFLENFNKKNLVFLLARAPPQI